MSQQPYQPYRPPPAPKKKLSTGAKAGIWVGGVFVFLIVVGIIGEATGAGKKAPAASTAAVATTAPASPSSAPVAPVKATVKPAATTAKPALAKTTTHPATKTAKAAAAPSPTCNLANEPNVIVWEQWPGLQDVAQLLGGWSPETCKSSIDQIMSTMPTGAGYYTAIAYQSDNPNYNVDATPAPRLKDVIEEVGQGC